MSLRKALELRAALLAQLREFFTESNFLEIQTPSLQSALVPEAHVNSFSVRNSNGAENGLYLLPSPELAMKTLLCSDTDEELGSVFQIAHCFRAEEEYTVWHQAEFLMLECYGLDYSPMDLIGLLTSCIEKLRQTVLPSFPAGSPVIKSFEEICRSRWGLSFDRYWQRGVQGLRELYRQVSTHPQEVSGFNADDLFHLFLVEQIEPYIAQNWNYCFLYPYPNITPLPAWILDKEELWADRWELYVSGIELANGCREENRPLCLERYLSLVKEKVSEKRYAEEKVRSWKKLPNCSGFALGLERLFKLGQGTKDKGEFFL